MVEYSPPQLDTAFYALSDRTRRAMLIRLAKRDCTISELAAPFELTFAAISKHLKVLEDAQFVVKKREGRTFRCFINPKPFREVSELLAFFESFWADRLSALDAFMNEANATGKTRHEQSSKAKTRTTSRRKPRH